MLIPTFDWRRSACRSMTRTLGIGTPGGGAAGFPCASTGDVVERAIASARPVAAKTDREANLESFMGLESCSCAEPNDPGLVVFRFHDGHGEVDLDWPEGRFPGDGQAGGNA